MCKFLILFLLAIACYAQTTNEQECAEHKFPNSIGAATREFFDSTRSNWLGTGPRPLRVVAWYPADSGSTIETIGNGTERISIYKDGNISSQSTKYPLILLSHGSGQNALDMQWLGHYLSSHGYITVSINHFGTPQEERQKKLMPLSDFCSWERPQDLSAVLNSLLQDPMFAGRIDTGRIGAAGFSAGGATVIWSAGAVLSMETLRKYSPPPPPILADEINNFIELSKTDPIVKKSFERAENSFKDNRIKAVFAHAPAIGYGFSQEGLSDVKVPVRIVVGENDIVAPAELNAKRYAKYISNSELVILPGELGHFTRQISEGDRSKDLEQVSKLALEFFNEKLNR